MRGSHRSSRFAALLPALLLAELLLAVPVAPVAAVTSQPADSPPFKPVPTGVATEVEAAPIDLSGAASAEGSGVEILADGTRIRPRDSKYTPPATDTEVVSARTENTSKTANHDGSFTVEASAGRLNFFDAQGIWQAIDLSLLPTGEGAFEVASNDRKVAISTKDASDALVEMRGGSALLRLRVPGYGQATVSDGRTIGGGPAEPATGSGDPVEPAATAEATVAPAVSPAASEATQASPTASPDASPAVSPGPGVSEAPTASPTPVAAPTPTPTPTPEVPVDPVVKPDAQPFPEGTVVVEGATGVDPVPWTP